GAVVIDAYNQLGYTAAAIGNHEFDYGPEGPVSVAAQAGVDPFGALKARLKQAKFPMLATNIYEARSGDRPAWLGTDGMLTLDAVVAGHTHAVVGHFIKGTPVIETWGLGRYFGLIDLYLDPRSQKVIAAKTKITPVVPICPLTDEKGVCSPDSLDRNPQLRQ